MTKLRGILMVLLLGVTGFMTACGVEQAQDPASTQVATDSVKEPVEEPAKEPTKEPVKESPNEAAKEPIKEPTQEPEKEPTKEQPKEVDPTPEPAKELPTPPAKEPKEVVSADPVVHTVEIIEFAFSPETIEVKAGDIIHFINRDTVGHTATAEDASFDTGSLKKDEGKQVTFSKAGEFTYICLPHPAMKGTIIVK